MEVKKSIGSQLLLNAKAQNGFIRADQRELLLSLGIEFQAIASAGEQTGRLLGGGKNWHLGHTGGSGTPPYVDIPKHPDHKDSVTTSPLTGCSFIVTELDSSTYRVFHDHRNALDYIDSHGSY